MSAAFLLAAPGSVLSDWTQVPGFEGVDVFSLFAQDGLVVAGASNGSWRSTDEGSSWKRIEFGLPEYCRITAMASGDRVHLAGVHCYPPSGIGAADGGLYRSRDSGATWQEVSGDWPHEPEITSILSQGPYLFLSAHTSFAGREPRSGVYRSEDHGESWVPMKVTGSSGPMIRQLASTSSHLFLTLDAEDVILRSSDFGRTWTGASRGLSSYLKFPGAIIGHGQQLFAYATSMDAGLTIHRSSDQGDSWNRADSGMPQYNGVRAFAAHGGSLYAGIPGPDPVYRSTDLGRQWTKVSDGFPPEGFPMDAPAICFAAGARFLFAGFLHKGIWMRPHEAGLRILPHLGRGFARPDLSALRFDAGGRKRSGKTFPVMLYRR